MPSPKVLALLILLDVARAISATSASRVALVPIPVFLLDLPKMQATFKNIGKEVTLELHKTRDYKAE